MSTNVALEILSRNQVECLHCNAIDDLGECATLITDRGGLTLVHCQCRTCWGRWRRVVCS